MEVLIALKQRIIRLIEVTERLKEQNDTLRREKEELKQKIDLLGAKVEIGNENTKELAEDRLSTINMVDDLLEGLNSFMESEN